MNVGFTAINSLTALSTCSQLKEGQKLSIAKPGVQTLAKD